LKQGRIKGSNGHARRGGSMGFGKVAPEITARGITMQQVPQAKLQRRRRRKNVCAQIIMGET